MKLCVFSLRYTQKVLKKHFHRISIVGFCGRQTNLDSLCHVPIRNSTWAGLRWEARLRSSYDNQVCEQKEKSSKAVDGWILYIYYSFIIKLPGCLQAQIGHRQHRDNSWRHGKLIGLDSKGLKMQIKKWVNQRRHRAVNVPENCRRSGTLPAFTW